MAYREVYESAGQGPSAQTSWLDASVDILSRALDVAGGNIDEAAKAVVAAHDAEARRWLARAAYRFWYPPLLALAAREGILPAGKRVGSWQVKQVFVAILAQENLPGRAEALRETTCRLDLASTAFAAVVADEEACKSFQAALLDELLPHLRQDAVMAQKVAGWPALPAADKEDVARQLSKVVCAAARTIRPDLFADMPEVAPLPCNEQHRRGSYNYEIGGKACYWFDAGDSAARFFSLCFHETEHLLQAHLTYQLPSLSENEPLRRAARLFADDSFAQMSGRMDSSADRQAAVRLWSEAAADHAAVSLYVVSDHAGAMRAYRSRPMEFFAYRQTALFMEAATTLWPALAGKNPSSSSGPKV
ncbi:MAG TPA: hypothetical protein DCW68_05465 [Rhodospirillaceae bacterium]|nr:MAG: hypothetical protein A2018_02185 [Alphaproteobacteria bacterium GWF2_58_20]HAU29544.1 hypothetical protein [Rhodospirillaceae bacterium]